MLKKYSILKCRKIVSIHSNFNSVSKNNAKNVTKVENKTTHQYIGN